MKKKVNRNILWSELFFRQLSKLGVKNAVLCPGSRNTPLIFGIVKEKRIKRYNLVDERSAAFFALGIAKKTHSPVVIITTSGTAVANLYPAIIEAYFQRVPLIICTADRPPELHNCGANQTINQKNIFRNHIRYFTDFGTPGININKFERLITLTKKALSIAVQRDPGPVHINFPFRKPFEPDNCTDTITDETLHYISDDKNLKNLVPSSSKIGINKKIISDFSAAKRILILFNVKNPSKKLLRLITRLSNKINIPIVDDNTSGIRFYKTSRNVVSNASAFLNTVMFDTEIILQFGDAPLSNKMLEFFKSSKAKKILINTCGDILDPSRTYTKVLTADPEYFCENLLKVLPKSSVNEYLNLLVEADKETEKLKKEFLKSSDITYEGKIVSEVINNLPANTNVFISNSMPVRDFDLFVSSSDKNLSVYTNRGTSGIDGINSTALGVASQSKSNLVLVTGDLSFYHDLNGLLASYKYNIPLVIILINNNGGGIFNMLPVSKHKNVFEDNFNTPTNLDFKSIVENYGGNFSEIKSASSLLKELETALTNKTLSVLEIKTDSKESSKQRGKYLKLISEQISKQHENKV